jgi:hypothetical protein
MGGCAKLKSHPVGEGVSLAEAGRCRCRARNCSPYCRTIAAAGLEPDAAATLIEICELGRAIPRHPDTQVPSNAIMGC